MAKPRGQFSRTAWLAGWLAVTGPVSALTDAESLADLPIALSNNAVAIILQDAEVKIVTAQGLGEGKTHADTSSSAWQYSLAENRWSALPDVPGEKGRLASSAVTVDGQVFLFGGYEVAADGGEVSTPFVYRLDGSGAAWIEFTRMPVPVEDSVALVYQDRYIYLVSGWHDVGNVNLVQVLDTVEGSWQQATPFPGEPVFGHAGVMTGDELVVCDGVRIVYPESAGNRKFESSSSCWYGRIDAENHRRIRWQKLPDHPGPARYRMAAGSDDDSNAWFIGGSANPYNFDGVGYDGKLSEPESLILRFDFKTREWSCHGLLQPATMDHRGLLFADGWLYLVGGMRSGQKVSNGLIRFRPPLNGGIPSTACQ